jgi:hypothetical protein
VPLDTASRLALLASRTQATSSRANVTTTVRWVSRATVRPSPRPPRSQLITVDPSIDGMTERLMRKPAPILAAAYTRRLVPVAQNAYDRWPVVTNLSRSLLAVRWTADEGTLQFQLEAGADYSSAIRDGETVEQLLRRPVLLAAQQIAADTAKGLGS